MKIEDFLKNVEEIPKVKEKVIKIIFNKLKDWPATFSCLDEITATIIWNFCDQTKLSKVLRQELMETFKESILKKMDFFDEENEKRMKIKQND